MMDLSSSAVVILQSVLGVALLTFVMAVLAGLTRLRGMSRAGLVLQEAVHAADIRGRLPASARYVNDNYNHLFEVPTVFYAAGIATVMLGQAGPLQARCAVAFLILRICHSIVQATFNRVSVRAALYVLSWFALVPLIVGTLWNTTVG